MTTVAFVEPCAAISRTMSSPVNALDERVRVGRRRDHVEIAERLLAPAHAARLRDEIRGCVLPQPRDDAAHHRQAGAEQRAVLRGRLLLCRQPLQHVLLGLGAEPGEAAQPALLGRRPELVHGRDAELLPDLRRGLRAETRELHEAADVRRDPLLALRERVDAAVVDDLDDLLLDRLADPGQFFRLAFQRQLRDGGGALAHALRGAPVGDDAERFGALELQQIGELLELLGDVLVPREGRGHRQRS